MTKLLMSLLLAASLCACSGPPDAQEPASPTAAKEPASDAAPALDPDQVATLKQMLASGGKACAEIVGIRPLAAQNTVEVTCIEQAGGTQAVIHVVDLGAI